MDTHNYESFIQQFLLILQTLQALQQYCVGVCSTAPLHSVYLWLAGVHDRIQVVLHI